MTTQSRLANELAAHYEVKKEIGAGGMATVFLARDLKHDRDVAIKVLHPDLGAALFPALEYRTGSAHRYYDVAADGRFLMVGGSGAAIGRIYVVENWFQELKKKFR